MEAEGRPDAARGAPARSRPYERLLWVGYALMGALIVTLAVVAGVTFRETVSQKDELLSGEAEDVMRVEALRSATELESRKLRSFLLLNDERLLQEGKSIERRVETSIRQLRERITDTRSHRLLDEVLRLHQRHRGLMAHAIGMRRRGVELDKVARFYDERVTLHRDELDIAFDALEQHQRAQFEEAKSASSAQARKTSTILVGAIVATALVASLTGVLLLLAFRALRTQQHALDHRLEELAQANRDLDAFSGRIAHDLKNVLAPLPMIARRLREPSADSMAWAAERVERVTERSLAMLEALLAFSRAGHASDASATSSVEQAVHDVIEDLRPLLAASQVEVELEVEALELRCSLGLLSIVLFNIIGNALKFMGDRPIRRVTIAAHQRGQWGVLSIEDSGPGISDEALARIFEPFYRVPGSLAPGTGIGLATVQRIVDAHSGKITVESRPERGTTFRVWLPLAVVPESRQ